ncbi:hypothetical protein CDAR_308671 [Caerostris darwini]|uniref:Uncharacterized protein n=1 Tax=Caerostris darwini TaxID=1538125 RepID=A0AAV4NUM8_9ARAC|nr:hypothetical protein CDAR_308671 [Caerostris darwini]
MLYRSFTNTVLVVNKIVRGLKCGSRVETICPTLLSMDYDGGYRQLERRLSKVSQEFSTGLRSGEPIGYTRR